MLGQYFEEKLHNFFAAFPNPHHFVDVGKVFGHLTTVPASLMYRK